MDKIIKNCRLCLSKDLKLIFDFGNTSIGNDLQVKKNFNKKSKKYPLKVLKCKCCNHFQLSYSISPDILYATNYTYLSSIGNSFVMHIKEYVNWISKNSTFSKNKFVLEIGSNDGTCLSEFKKLGYNICGVDPAQLPSKIANENGIYTINDFFNKNTIKKILKKFGKPFLITSQNALAHIDDLQGTFRNIYNLLDDNGYFIFEVGYFLSVLEKKLFDTIYHEHLDYHHASPLVQHLSNIGFQAIKIIRVNSQGGSIRLLFKKSKKNYISQNVKAFVEKEKKSYLYDNNYIDVWLNNIKIQLNKMRSELVNKRKKGFQIIAYGAPTKATLLLKLSKLNNSHIDYIVEDNTLKIDKFLPNGIPIKSFNYIDKNEKKVVLILAWNFANDIISKLKLNNISAYVIVPLPSLRKVNI